MTKKATQTTAHKSTRSAVPYAKIISLLQTGKTIPEIAKAIGRYDEKSADPTKPVRAIISRMRTIGFTDPKTGEFSKFKAGKKGERVTDAFAKQIKAVKKSTKAKAEPEAEAVAATT